jgi:hypothetical protein
VRKGDEWIVRSLKGRDAALQGEALDLEISLEAIYALVETEHQAPVSEASAENT